MPSWYYTALTMGRASLRSGHRLAMTQNHLLARSYATGYTSKAVGSKYTADFRQYALDGQGRVVSHFHDIPLDLDAGAGTANIVVEVPRWLNAKFEISTTIPGNPIVQDVKKGLVRFVANLFPYHGYIHNYGAFPQTWEDPNVESDMDGLRGDGDPLDVCEIGLGVLPTGSVHKVKILGSLALVDDGELDWKVIVVRCDDPLASEVFDVHDVFVKCPGLLEATREWFRDYKLPDGKPRNKFALNGAYRNRTQTIATIVECQDAWRKMVRGCDDVAVENATLEGTPGHAAPLRCEAEVLAAAPEPDAAVPASVSRVHYVGN